MKKNLQKTWKVLKDVLNVSWKAGVTVICICLLFEFFEVNWSTFAGWFGKRESTIVLSSKVALKENKQKNFCRLIDRKSGRRISNEKFQCVFGRLGKDSLSVFIDMEGKRGYLNVNTGTIAIPAQYRHAWQFCGERFAGVVGYQDDSLRFIDRDGKLVFDKAFAFELGEDYVFHDGVCIMAKNDDKGSCVYGLIGEDGEWILEQKYNCMCRDNDLIFVSLKTENGEYRQGYWNPEGHWEYEPIYQRIDFCSADNTVFLTENNVKMHVRPDGSVIEPFVVDYVSLLDYFPAGESFSENDGMTQRVERTNSKVAKYSTDGRCGLLDLKTGKPLTPALFDDIFAVSEDIIRCELIGTIHEILYNSRGERIN